jgi:DNA excision repair protein ERCC-1
MGNLVKDACAIAFAQASSNTILVSRRQQGNPLLNHIRNVRWQFADIAPDYILGQTTCALFLSLRCDGMASL